MNDPFIKIAAKNFDLFCKRQAESKLTKRNSKPVSIPKHIHLVWLGSPPPQKVLDNADTWKRFNPSAEVTIWTEKKVKNELFPRFKKEYPDLSELTERVYHEADTFAENADVVRLIVLFLDGGVYSDANDLECLKSFDDLHENGISFYACLEDNKKSWKWIFYACNALIGAAPRHEIIEYCLRNIKPKSQGNKITERTGPVLLSEGCKKALLGKNSESILILPCSYVYPLPFSEDACKLSREYVHSHYVEPETLAVHFWEGSWKN